MMAGDGFAVVPHPATGSIRGDTQRIQAHWHLPESQSSGLGVIAMNEGGSFVAPLRQKCYDFGQKSDFIDWVKALLPRGDNALRP